MPTLRPHRSILGWSAYATGPEEDRKTVIRRVRDEIRETIERELLADAD